MEDEAIEGEDVERNEEKEDEDSGRFKRLWTKVSGVLSEEKKQQLVSDLGDFGGKVGGVVSSLAHRVVEGLENAQEKIDETLDVLKLEHERFLNECDEEDKCSSSSSSSSQQIDEPELYTGRRRLLPWEPSETPEIKEAFLELSKNEATFKEAPPENISYCLDVRKRKALILELLGHDPILLKAHARLAHKLGEDTFWRNFFYRCALLRKRFDLDEDQRQSCHIVSPEHSRPYDHHDFSPKSPTNAISQNTHIQVALSPSARTEGIDTQSLTVSKDVKPTKKQIPSIQLRDDPEVDDFILCQTNNFDDDEFVLLNSKTLDSQPDLQALLT